jgi:hypothetical protein
MMTGEKCITHGRLEMNIKCLPEILNGRDLLGDIGIDGRKVN